MYLLLSIIFLLLSKDRQNCYGFTHFPPNHTEELSSTMQTPMAELNQTTESFSEGFVNDTATEKCDSFRNQTENVCLKKSHAVAGKFEHGMVIVPMFLAIGLFGNSMTFLIMRRPNFSHMSTNIILTSLSISDTLLIIMFPFNKKFFLQLLPSDPRSYSLSSCKIFYWFWRTSKMTSSWLVVLISCERFVAVWFPLKANRVNSRTHISIAVVTVYFVIGGFNLIWGFIADVINNNGICTPNFPVEPKNLEVSKALVLTGTLIYSIIPASFVFILNALIIGQVERKRRIRKYLSESQSGHQTADQTTKMTVMLITVSTAFVVLVVPISIAHCYTLISGESIFTSTTPHVVIIREISQTLEQLNYSINFFLYVISSEKFRVEFKAMFSSKCCKGNQNKIKKSGKPTKLTPSTSGTSKSSNVATTDSSVRSSVTEGNTSNGADDSKWHGNDVENKDTADVIVTT